MSNIRPKEMPQDQELVSPQKLPSHLVQIECTKCGNIGKPQKWEARLLFGIAFLFTGFGGLLYFICTNAYICKKCGERNRLKKILNDHRKIFINCMSRNTFLIVSSSILMLFCLIFLIAEL